LTGVLGEQANIFIRKLKTAQNDFISCSFLFVSRRSNKREQEGIDNRFRWCREEFELSQTRSEVPIATRYSDSSFRVEFFRLKDVIVRTSVSR